MSTLREAAQQALEALKKSHPVSNSDKDLNRHSEALSALHAALEAEPTDEVAKLHEELEWTRQQWAEAGKAYIGAAMRAAPKLEAEPKTALEQYHECDGDEEPDPVERLRYFCSCAMRGQDWLDVESFFDAINAELKETKTNVLELRAHLLSMDGMAELLEKEVVALRAALEAEPRITDYKSTPRAKYEVNFVQPTEPYPKLEAENPATLREAAQQALEYLKLAKAYGPPMGFGNTTIDDAIHNLRAALEAGPVEQDDPQCLGCKGTGKSKGLVCKVCDGLGVIRPAPKLEAESQPVAWTNYRMAQLTVKSGLSWIETENHTIPLYAAPKLEAEPQCRGIPRMGCDYLSACGIICNKCGHEHSVMNLYAAPQADRDAIKQAWIAGYYHAGYTNDSAYADQQAEDYAAMREGK